MKTKLKAKFIGGKLDGECIFIDKVFPMLFVAVGSAVAIPAGVGLSGASVYSFTRAKGTICEYDFVGFRSEPFVKCVRTE